MGKHKIDQLFSDKLSDYQTVPQLSAWESLEQSLDQKNHRSVWPWMGIAASALLAIVSSWYLLSTDDANNNLEYDYAEAPTERMEVPVDLVIVPVIIQIPASPNVKGVTNNANIPPIIAQHKVPKELVAEVKQAPVIIAQNSVLEPKLTAILQEPLPIETDESPEILMASSTTTEDNSTQHTLQPLTITYIQGTPEQKSKFTQAIDFIEDVRAGDKKFLDFNKIKKSIQSKLKFNKDTNSK